MSLADYVMQHATRGDCTCGRCIDARNKPQQPTGHTVDLVFFKVAATSGNKEHFRRLAQAQYPHWFDGKEHSYLETGADMGDQGIALMTMAYGALLGVFKLLTPLNVLPDAPREQQLDLASKGLITIQVN